MMHYPNSLTKKKRYQKENAKSMLDSIFAHEFTSLSINWFYFLKDSISINWWILRKHYTNIKNTGLIFVTNKNAWNIYVLKFLYENFITDKYTKIIDKYLSIMNT